MRRSLAFVTVVAVLGAACSSSSGESLTSTTAQAPPGITSSTTSTTSPGIETTTTAATTATTTTTTRAATTTSAGTQPSRTPSVPLSELDLVGVTVASGLASPLFVDAPMGDPRLFVVEQVGRILIVDEGTTTTFLDVRDRVRSGGEQGLLGLAFHPTYVENGRFFVHYTESSGASVIAEFAGDTPAFGRADPASERVLLTVPQPARNHNGGMLAFGPDGLLYIGLGDGGGAGDQFDNGGRPDTLLGTILRIDVDDTGDAPYGIPEANPFTDGEEGAPEVWAWGLRNPWRFSFDGDLIFIGDVGQGRWEEIDVASVTRRGIDFGWSTLEGFDCFGAAECDRSRFDDLLFVYPHENGACSVTGGYVYRGAAIPDLIGTYLFADYCTGVVSGFRIDPEGLYDLTDWENTLAIRFLTSFGTDGFGELYVTAADGRVLRIEQG